MRGAALKLGQMISIQDENVLPPAVSLNDPQTISFTHAILHHACIHPLLHAVTLLASLGMLQAHRELSAKSMQCGSCKKAEIVACCEYRLNVRFCAAVGCPGEGAGRCRHHAQAPA